MPDCTLADLHEFIQAAFGWENYHMHQFEIEGERYAPPAPDDFDFGLEMRDETDVPHSKLIPKSGRNTSTTLATAGDTKSCSRGFRPTTRRRIPRCASKEHEPAHRKNAADLAVMSITSLPSLTRT